MRIDWGPRSFDLVAPITENANPWQVNGALAAIQSAIPTMVGGIGRWTIQIPRTPLKREYIFKRNMENADRLDLEDIAAMLEALTKPGSK